MRRWVAAALLALLPLLTWQKKQPGSSIFFGLLDKNRNGQIDRNEARDYIEQKIGGTEYDSQQELSQAVDLLMKNVDGVDPGATVSLPELDKHLDKVLEGTRVWDWIRHGVGLPQYAEVFRENAITPLDLPMIIHGDVLEQDLKISSAFHRAKILRAMRLLLLGLGNAPAPPTGVTCATGGRTQRAVVVVRWQPPPPAGGGGGGQPHKYVVERQDLRSPLAGWQLVAEPDDASVPVVDVLPPGASSGGVRYRVSAWNLYGQGSAMAADCGVDRRLEGLAAAAAAAQHLPQGAPPAGSSSSSSSSGGGGGGGSLSTMLQAYAQSVAGQPAPPAPRSWLWSASQTLLFVLVPLLSRLLPPSALRRAWGAIESAFTRGTSGSDAAAAAAPALAAGDSRLASGAEATAGTSARTNSSTSGSGLLDGRPDGPHGGGAARSHPTAGRGVSDFGYARQDSAPQAGAGALVGAAGAAAPSGAMPRQASLQDLLAGGSSQSQLRLASGGPRVSASGAGRSVSRNGSYNDITAAANGGGADGSFNASSPPRHASSQPLAGLASAFTPNSSRKQCAAAGCGLPIDRWHLRAYKSRHYCGRCQQHYCLQHTAFSSHGPTGSCGHESSCVCNGCFRQFKAAYQEFLMAHNTLGNVLSSGGGRGGGGGGGGGATVGSPPRSSIKPPLAPPTAAAGSGGGGGPRPSTSGATGGGSGSGGVTARPSLSGAGGVGATTSEVGVDGAGGGSTDPSGQQPLLPSGLAASNGSVTSAATVAPQVCGDGGGSPRTDAKTLWGRAGRKMGAVLRFKAAGTAHHGRASRDAPRPCGSSSGGGAPSKDGGKDGGMLG